MYAEKNVKEKSSQMGRAGRRTTKKFKLQLNRKVLIKSIYFSD